MGRSLFIHSSSTDAEESEPNGQSPPTPPPPPQKKATKTRTSSYVLITRVGLGQKLISSLSVSVLCVCAVGHQCLELNSS
jgi:hypothetical protein